MWPSEERALRLQPYRSMLYQIGDRDARAWAVLSHAGQGHMWRAYKAMLELAHDTFPDKFDALIATALVTEPDRASRRNDFVSAAALTATVLFGATELRKTTVHGTPVNQTRTATAKVGRKTA